MKNIITILLVIMFAQGVGAQIEPNENVQKKRSNVVLANGMVGSSKIGFGFRYKSLYRLQESIQLGWGIGIESYDASYHKSFIPISLDLMGDIFKSGKTPFYMISIGYGIALPEEESFSTHAQGGLMIDFSLGYRSKSNPFQPFIALGYRIQNAFYEGTDSYFNTDKEVVYKRWSVTTGILF